MAKVSVLIPTYNRQRFIIPAINSILNQTYDDFEILVYDDGSNDNTKFMIETIKDKRVKYFEGLKNRGVSYARNKLLELCKTDIACWADSDDLSNKYRLQIQLKKLIENDNSYIATNSVFFQKDRDVNINETRTDNVKYEYPFASIMFRVDKMFSFDEALVHGEDLKWRKEMNQKYKNYCINNVLYYIRMHPDRIGVNKNK